MNEYWKLLNGFKYPYWVSSLGRFKNMEGKILKFHTHPKGYQLVQLPKDGYSRGARWQAHRLVAKAFIPNPDQLPQVNHVDSDKKNNAVSNLQWVTNKQNAHHSIANGTFYMPGKGEKNPRAKLTNKQAEEIRETVLDLVTTCTDLAYKFNVSIHTIYAVRAGNSYT